MNTTLQCNSVTDLEPWNSKTRDFQQCFLHICIELPIFAIFSVSSAYYIGKRRLSYTCYTAWNKQQSFVIYFRAFIVGLLAISPVSSVMLFVAFHQDVSLLEGFLTLAKTMAWLLHLVFILQLKRGVNFNTRGPKAMIIAWFLTALVSCIVLRSRYINMNVKDHSSYSESQNDFFLIALWTSVIETLLNFFYLLTLIPGFLDQSHYRALHNDMRDTHESQNYLNHEANSFVGFNDDDIEMDLGTAKENSGFLSNLFFMWVTPILHKGACGFLHSTDDLYDLPPYLSTRHVAKCFQNFLKVPSTNSLIRRLHRAFGFEFYAIGLLKLLADVFGFCGPILLNLLVNYMESDTQETGNISSGYLYVMGLFFATSFGALCTAHFNMYMAEVKMKIRVALVTDVFGKVLNLRQGENMKFSAGEIINFLSQDTGRIVNFCPSFHALWSIPFQILISLYLLYMQIGISFLAGVIFAIILIPINRVIANKIGVLSTKMMKFKDKRVNLMSEILYGIRVVKYHGWESFFTNRIHKIREKELACLKGRKYLDAMCVYFWATTPVLVSVLSFATYILLGNTLTAASVFTSLALFNMLINPLNALPWVINGIVEAYVSVKRISTLLNIEEIPLSLVYDHIESEDQDIHLIAKDVTYRWTSEPDAFQLNQLNFSVKRGQLIGVVGEVGSGKSGLLLSIMGELEKTSGQLQLDDYQTGFAVVLQEPWIRNQTIKSNILFGESFNQSHYKAVLDACSLNQDLEEFDRGDETLVGEHGITLSGGQKIRISLARALYNQKKNFYLLDDIFSAVDYKVARELNSKCINGLLKDKTRIICTHHVNFLRKADWILVMDKGCIINQGTPSVILPIFFSDEEDFSLERPSSTSEMNSSKSTEGLPKEVEILTSDRLRASNLDGMDYGDDEENRENQEEGALKTHVYKKYIEAVGPILSVVILLFLLLMQISRNASDFWLAHWISAAESNYSNSSSPPMSTTIRTTTVLPVILQTGSGNDNRNLINNNLSGVENNEEWGFQYWDATTPVQPISNQYQAEYHDHYSLHRSIFEKSGLDPQVQYYFAVFIVIGIVNSLFTLGRAFFFAYGSIKGGQRMHEELLLSIIKAKMSFFWETSIGRIINRFSSDQSVVDDSLPFIFNILLANFYGLLGTLFVTCYALPWILVIIIPMLLVSNNIQKYYRHTSRQLRRLASVSLSPLYANFSETLKGILVIRAMRVGRRFQDDNENYLEENQKAEFATNAVSQWLSIRLQIVGVFIITGVGFIGVLQHSFQVANSAMLGLAISYALTVTNSLSSFVTFFTETEKEMVAVERVVEYTETVEAESDVESLLSTPYGWPSQGVVAFSNVSLQYKPDLPYALKNVSFETRPREKVGVVGRTGSGKSSLFQVLFRMVDNFEGVVNVDTVNTKNLNLKFLRSKICIIPQDPFIFTGTLRENLDPEGCHRDDLLMRALEKCQLRPLVQRLGGVDAFVGESGSLLSLGQKQLLCLARALVINPKILCIDEGTANVDLETDKIIQGTIRTSFAATTIITIAHRYSTILHSDRVVVMKSGEVVEFDQPQTLLKDKRSYFYQIVHGNDEA